MEINNHNFIQQLRDKNEDALMYLIDEYGGLIKSVIAKNMSCLEEEQHECMNDVLLAIWEHIDLYHPEKNSFKNWIAAIAKYKAIDYMRKYKKEISNISYDEISDTDSYVDNHLEQEIDAELSERINELLSCLKEKDRELLILLYANEEPIETVENALHMKKSVIYNRLSRAKKKIRKRMRCNHEENL